MRTDRWLVLALALCALLGAPDRAGAQSREPRGGEPATAAPIELRLEAPASLPVGARAQVEAVALLAPEVREPLLLTPRAEGAAIEVVRGRLRTADAEAGREEATGRASLRFRVPIVARRPGRAILRVQLSAYRCAPRCETVSAAARAILEVGATEPGAEGRNEGRAIGRKPQEGPEGAPGGEAQPEEARARTSSLSWIRLEGAEACVGTGELARAVEAHLGRRVFVSAAEAELSVEGRAEAREGGGFRATVELRDAEGQSLGQRVIEDEDPSCARLGGMLSVVLALMIDPSSGGTQESSAQESGAQESGEGGERHELVREVVRVERVEVPVERDPRPEERWRFGFAASLAGALGLLPEAAVGGSASAMVTPPGFVPLLLRGSLWPYSRADSRAGPPSGALELLAAYAGLMICPLAHRDPAYAAFGCAGLELGGAFVIGGEATERERVLGQARVEARLDVRIVGPLYAHLALAGLVPFRHEPWQRRQSDGSLAALYRPEVIAGDLELGVAVHLD